MTGYINPTLGWTLTFIGLVGMVASVFIYLSGRNDVYRLLLINEKGSEIKQIPETLTLMHQRIRQMRTELAKKDIGMEKAARLQEKMHRTLPIGQWLVKRIQGMQKSGQEAKFIWAVEFMNKHIIGSEYGSGYEKHICDIGGMLETEDVGLRPVLQTDPEYKPLKDKLERQYAGVPQKISKPILKYERYLYGMSSTILWDSYRKKYLGQQLPVVVEARISQFDPYAEDTMMNKLLEDVVSSINKYFGG